MPRYLLVRGIAGHLVDPGVLAAQGGVRRFLGMRRLAELPSVTKLPPETSAADRQAFAKAAMATANLCDWYEPADEIVLEDAMVDPFHAHLQKQAGYGHLEILARVTAPDMATAIKLMPEAEAKELERQDEIAKARETATFKAEQDEDVREQARQEAHTKADAAATKRAKDREERSKRLAAEAKALADKRAKATTTTAAAAKGGDK